MSAEQNKNLVRRWVEAGWNNGDFALVDTDYTPDYFIHDPSAPAFPGGQQAFKGFVTTLRTAIPDFHMTINEMVAEGDKVAWRFTCKGTNLGELMGIPPSGNPVRNITGICLSRFENGKWAEDYVNWDTLGLLQQIGAIPTPNAEPAHAR